MELLKYGHPDVDPVLITPKRSEIQEWARQVCEDPKVRHTILVKARKGELAPRILELLMAYAYGKPAEQVVMSNGAEGMPFTLNLIQYAGEV